RRVRRRRRPVGELHAIVALADLQYGAVAPVSRDRLRTRGHPGLQYRLPGAGLGWQVARHRPGSSIQRARQSAVAWLEPDHRERGFRARGLDGDVPTMVAHTRI